MEADSMAEDRLKTLMKSTDMMYSQGSPVLLEACALYQDNLTSQCIAQLKWKSIDSRRIKAVSVEITLYDSFNQRQPQIEYHYKNLNAKQNETFGEKEAIIIDNNVGVKFEVNLKAVSFEDGTIYRPEDKSLHALPAPKKVDLSGELLAQYKRDLAAKGFGDASKFQPQKTLGLWQCGCGNWQYDSSPCLLCGATQAVIDNAADHQLLMANLKKHEAQIEKERQVNIKAEEEKRKKELEARAIEEQNRREKEAKQEVERKKRKKLIAIAGVAIAIIAALVCGYIFYLVPQGHYNKGVELANLQMWEEAILEFQRAEGFSDSDQKILATRYTEGESKRDAHEWDGAVQAFTQALGYLDASTQIQETYYQKAAYYYSMKQYDEAYSSLLSIKGYKTVDDMLENDANLIEAAERARIANHNKLISQLKSPGSTVVFGAFEQDNDISNGKEPIEWLVLDVEDGHSLLISQYVLYHLAFMDKYGDDEKGATWAKSDVRKWLNEDFFTEAFSSDEQQAIIQTKIDNGYTQGYSSSWYEKDTEDKVFLLSYKEVLKYFPTESSRCVLPTEYAKKIGGSYAKHTGKYEGYDFSIWWTRSQGYNPAGFTKNLSVVTFNPDGSYFESTGPGYRWGVRPVIWVDISSDSI